MGLQGDVGSRQEGFAFAIYGVLDAFVKVIAACVRFSGMTRDRSFTQTPQTSVLLAILVPQTLENILEGLWGGLP
jgi:hypothetical protein